MEIQRPQTVESLLAGAMNPYIYCGLTKQVQNRVCHISLSKSIDHTINIVCDYFGVSKLEILSRRKTANIAQARMIAIFLCAENYKNPLTYLGQIFDRDHSTIIYNRNICAFQMRFNVDMAYKISEIRENLLRYL